MREPLRGLIILSFFATGLFATPKEWKHSLAIEVTGGGFPDIRNPSFSDTLESYGGNWMATSMEQETALSWENLPPFLGLEINESYSDFFHLEFFGGIRRDPEAWFNSPTGQNIPLAFSELDINTPLRGSMEFRSGMGSLRLGRFTENWGPSKRGITLSTPIPLDAVRGEIRFPMIRYRLLLAAMDPWLLDSDKFPEKIRQALGNGSENRKRSYTENAKTLAAHRLDFKLGNFDLGLNELIMIGGKHFALNDANPFTIWHNDYNDGYSNVLMSFDLTWTSSLLGQFYLEAGFDDLAAPVGEEFAGKQGILSGLLGWQKSFAISTADSLFLKTEWIYEDPAYGNHATPLKRMSHRKIYRSNYREQYAPGFADTYIADYPLAYFRGPDVSDLWLDAVWKNPSTGMHTLRVGWLQKGDTRWTGLTENEFEKRPTAPNGVVERELRLRYLAEVPLDSAFTLRGEATFRSFESRGHLAGNTDTDWTIGAGMSWRWGVESEKR